MGNESSSNLYVTVIGVLMTFLLAGAGFYLHQLGQKIDDQSQTINSQLERIIKLEKNFSIVVGVLNTKMPNTNLPALVTLSSKKDISPEKVATVIPMIEKDPMQAKVYLKNELYFDSKEVDAVMSSAHGLYKKPSATEVKPTIDKKENVPFN